MRIGLRDMSLELMPGIPSWIGIPSMRKRFFQFLGIVPFLSCIQVPGSTLSGYTQDVY
ncbi:MAG: hypothetical protein J6X58_07910 [Bacteroidales bacterium]|nr:hypothetical protein [Bacteroidales bacterium]